MTDDAPLSRFLLDGRWRFQSQLGFGADGTVYLARDEKTGERVAVKVYDSLVGRSTPSVLKKLAEEAEIAREFESPYLVQVHHYGVAPGEGGVTAGYLVMEYLEGQTLREMLERRITALPAPEAVDIVRMILDALSALHRRGYVHRDLKPENVFLRAPTSAAAQSIPVKLFDLGAVRPIREAHIGVARGTPIYVAPEVASRADHVGPGCDVYSAGILLFELIVGRPPLDPTATPEQLVAQHVYGSLDALPDVVGNLPLGPIYQRATARDPKARYASADEMLEALALMRPVRSDRLPMNSPFSSPSVDDSVQVPVAPPDPDDD